VCSIAAEASGQILFLNSSNSPVHHDIVRIDPNEFSSESPFENQSVLTSIDGIQDGNIATALWIVPVPEPAGAAAGVTPLVVIGFIAASRRTRR
jgi:hypothetical protein